jgi:predicted RNA-binding protein with PIN domain
VTPAGRRGVYPGSFDPPTVAHLAIADAARDAGALDVLDLAISRVALGKAATRQRPLPARVAALEQLTAARPWLRVVVTDAQLITDIASAYDVVVMGADKWAQVCDPVWYDGSVEARDDALTRLPRVLVAPRAGFGVESAELLDVDPAHAEISSSAARDGQHHLIAPDYRRRLIVDGNNVIGSRPDGWWRDRAGATRRLVESLQDLAGRSGDRISVVLDGRPLAGLREGVHGGVLVAYATRAGRDAADDRIVEEVARDREPASLIVVTSDRGLGGRVRLLGATVVGAGTLLDELDQLGASG